MPFVLADIARVEEDLAEELRALQRYGEDEEKKNHRGKEMKRDEKR